MSISEVLYSSKSEEWGTPQDLFNELDAEFHFDVDVCATDKNAKCSKFFTKEQDGLKQSWTGKTVWCNPPYGKKIAEWVKKAYQESCGGGGGALFSFFQRGRTRDTSTITYTTRQIFALFAGGFALLMNTGKSKTQPRFHQ